MTFKFKDGQEVMDYVTGNKGIITSCRSNLGGDNQYLVQPKAKDTTGRPLFGDWVHEGRLVIPEKEEVVG